MIYCVPKAKLVETFAQLRACGRGERECQVLWLSPWADARVISAVVHTAHRSYPGGFEVRGDWITSLWAELAKTGAGIRVQVHTHPGSAFHSATDDRWPIVHTPGFLSLVIPDFGLGSVSLDGAHVVEVSADGRWCRVRVSDRLVIG